ncbi:iron-sulfur cluster repair protein DnrN [Podospora fimiseda]|uniref:Iron-sulfur cluster repair protein DnrN n=1 Tax=Podospora fimiseda TaxID=252190 RepID=A0AAN7BY96_9PEZI|nr:iron-sulfur cluster repair protein DnrN [Podospora fimiseda]
MSTPTTTTTTLPPKYTDSPLPLIPTPKFLTGKTDSFTIEASHMALSHNAFIRGFNTVYQQAPRVKSPSDKIDFAGYCLAWADCVYAHHHYEETEFFPNLDKAAGQKGLMDGAVHEHEAFQGGLNKFKEYLEENLTEWESKELIGIMDEFKDALHGHLRDEPGMIVELGRYSTVERPIDILGIAEAAGKKQVNLSFMFNTLPVFFLNMETIEFEGGMWHGVFPPLNGLAKAVMLKGVPMWHSGRWRFVSCTPEGTLKDLAV